MISSQSLEMIPPILGRERTFGWYPPAHEQFAKVPYKTMAVLDDYSHFKMQNSPEILIEKIIDAEPILESGGTVLSSKLNAIRQDLTRRRIDPSVIRQSQFRKFENVNQYMNIAPNWKPKYPEPNLVITRSTECRHSAPASRNVSSAHSEESNLHVDKYGKKPDESDSKTSSENKILQSSTLADFQEFKSTKPKNGLLQRPHTAPGNSIRNAKSEKISSASHSRQVSANKISKESKLTLEKNHIGNKLTQSEVNIAHLSYGSDLVKYKWLMEVPGDPFSIKQPHIPVKQPYFHKIEECKTLPPEIRFSKQNRDTFFYNTLPSQAMTFDISPNFTSEKYNAMKNLLRSQGKWNYSNKNFSFVY